MELASRRMWPFSSTDFSKNETAARADFLGILRALDQEGNADQELKKFLNGFKTAYEMYKKRLKTKEGLAKPSGNKSIFSSEVRDILDQAEGYIQEYQRERDSEKLGKGMGVFLAICQFGLGSGYFDHYEYGQSVIEKVRSMMATLHKIHRTIKCLRIAARVSEIQRETQNTTAYSPTDSITSTISVLLSESLN